MDAARSRLLEAVRADSSELLEVAKGVARKRAQAEQVLGQHQEVHPPNLKERASLTRGLYASAMSTGITEFLRRAKLLFRAIQRFSAQLQVTNSIGAINDVRGGGLRSTGEEIRGAGASSSEVVEVVGDVLRRLMLDNAPPDLRMQGKNGEVEAVDEVIKKAEKTM